MGNAIKRTRNIGDVGIHGWHPLFTARFPEEAAEHHTDRIDVGIHGWQPLLTAPFPKQEAAEHRSKAA